MGASSTELDLLDRWKASDVKTFKGFWPKDEYGKRAIGADARGLCMFTALKRAAELAGRPDIVTQDDFDKFVADELRKRGEDLTRDNFIIAGRRGSRILEEVPLHNGLYFVVAYSRNHVGHAFVLRIQKKKGKILGGT
ncbi:hypothetical protein PInf_004786 [Phytophthora infestans]|nr:hypothetical protein PInf_004786 [Phytophthora infestans]